MPGVVWQLRDQFRPKALVYVTVYLHQLDASTVALQDFYAGKFLRDTWGMSPQFSSRGSEQLPAGGSSDDALSCSDTKEDNGKAVRGSGEVSTASYDADVAQRDGGLA